MIRGLGCDVCAISRMRKSIENPRFLERFFTEEERGYIAARSQDAQTAAGLFAAKEAFVKALGTGFDCLMPGDVAVSHDGQGAPFYLLNEKTRTAMGLRGAEYAHLSISHDGDTAMAVAILEG